MVVEGVSQQLQFNHYCGLFITSIISTCRDLNFRPQLCAVIKFRAKFKSCPAGTLFFSVATYCCLLRHK